MANIPCTNRIVCPGPTPGLDADDPVTNFSSEQVDGVNFTEMSWPIIDFTNPFTPDDPNNPPDTCDNPISQEEAELCAINKTFTDQATLNGRGGHIVSSHAQTCAFNCPDGSAFFWTVPAGAFADFNQSVADQRAKAYACRQVGLNAVCIMVESTSCCLGVNFLSVLTVDGGFAPYTIKMIAGTLPPGVGFVQDTNTTGFFSGVPSAPGIYSVAISARDSHGNMISRTVTFTVLAISNANTMPLPTVPNFYNQKLLGVGGTAPYSFSNPVGLAGGLTLQTDGFVVGIPIGTVGTGFTCTMSDAAGNSCVLPVIYASPCAFGTIVYEAPIQSFPTPPNTGTVTATFPTPHSVRLVGTAHYTVGVGSNLQYQIDNAGSPITFPPLAVDTVCKVKVTVNSISGFNQITFGVFDGTFTTPYVFFLPFSPVLGTIEYSFTIPAGKTSLGVTLAVSWGNAVGTQDGAMDIQFDFGV